MGLVWYIPFQLSTAIIFWCWQNSSEESDSLSDGKLSCSILRILPATSDKDLLRPHTPDHLHDSLGFVAIQKSWKQKMKRLKVPFKFNFTWWEWLQSRFQHRNVDKWCHWTLHSPSHPRAHLHLENLTHWNIEIGINWVILNYLKDPLLELELTRQNNSPLANEMKCCK